ncbi:MAG: hypothetical protein D6719_03060, partial [Candidatus Dadabacteria bacterium]
MRAPLASRGKKLERNGRIRLISNKSLQGPLLPSSSFIESVLYDPSDTTCQEMMRKNPEIESCSPDFIVRAEELPNDPDLSLLWGISSSEDNDIDAPEAWGISSGSSDVVVAVIDSGIDFNHPDLVDNLWVNPGEIADNGIDDDGNGYVDDIYGVSVLDGQAPLDDHGHGTHVAGVIGAVGNNGTGVAGVNWDVKIIA